MATHNETGKNGELIAIEWLVRNGFKLVTRNWRYAHLEIDIICTKEEILHFIEVKTRTNDHYGLPEEAVSRKKIRNLLQAGQEYLFHQREWRRVQYDILSITLYKNQ
ncbi:MAG: YraN family protein, partial [Chitinophagaceae bacterium]|nr:YraN family protein [Chitinophagaceae bacterium]